MKKTFAILSLVAFAAISLSSCKKDYTCECKYNNGIDANYSINYEFKDVKKSDATDACDTWNSTIKIADPAGSCKLK